jgi:hypothetical protein
MLLVFGILLDREACGIANAYTFFSGHCHPLGQL